MYVQWWEFLPACTAILMPVAISIYQSRKNSNTVSSYMLGGKTMSVPVILLSHISASISTTIMLGSPTETYIYGAGHSIVGISYLAIGLVQNFILLPVLYDLQMLSLFEYCEQRFNRTVREMMSLINSIWEITYTATSTYGCAMVLSQFLGISVFFSTSIILGICIFYTSLGGYKGVIYSDVFQCLVMWGYLIMMCVLGLHHAGIAGGSKKLMNLITQSDRYEFFIFDPKLRANFWNIIIGSFLNRAISLMGSSTYQRSISLPTLQQAQKAILLGSIGMTCYIFLSHCIGFMLYATYRGCDPTTAGITARYDMTMVHFIQSIGSQVPGFVGIFLAGALSGSLSTMATCLNNASGVIYRDLIQILFKTPPTEVQDSRNIKILCLVLGVVVWLLASSLHKIGTLLTMAVSFSGLFGGAFAAVFVLGLFVPKVGPKGVMCGIVPWLGIIIYVISTKLTTTSLRYPTKVLRVDECPFNVTAPLRNSSLPIDEEVWESTNFIGKISPFWYSIIGFVFVLLVSITSSFLLNESKDAHNVDSNLLSPMIRKAPNQPEASEMKALTLESSRS